MSSGDYKRWRALVEYHLADSGLSIEDSEDFEDHYGAYKQGTSAGDWAQYLVSVSCEESEAFL